MPPQHLRHHMKERGRVDKTLCLGRCQSSSDPTNFCRSGFNIIVVFDKNILQFLLTPLDGIEGLIQWSFIVCRVYLGYYMHVYSNFDLLKTLLSHLCNLRCILIYNCLTHPWHHTLYKKYRSKGDVIDEATTLPLELLDPLARV